MSAQQPPTGPAEAQKASAGGETGRLVLFIWESVQPVSGSWHNGGGLAIVAADLESARAMMKYPDCTAKSEPPDYSAEVIATEPRMFVFPDAGCC